MSDREEKGKIVILNRTDSMGRTPLLKVRLSRFEGVEREIKKLPKCFAKWLYHITFPPVGE